MNQHIVKQDNNSLLSRYQELWSEVDCLSLPSSPVTLIAVSKAQSIESIETLLKAGHRIFGENRVQEALAKWPALKQRYPDTELHLIGSLQTNKVKEALALFDVIETLDRPALIDAIAKERIKQPKGCARFLIQVNTGEELQKGGVSPQEVTALYTYAVTKGVPVCGVMCVPPADDIPAPHFALLYNIAKSLKLPICSMGMSNDYATAIRLGATHVRIGTALFGKREP